MGYIKQHLVNYIIPLFVILFFSNCFYSTNGGYVYYHYWNEGSGFQKFYIDSADSKSFNRLKHNACYAKDKNVGYYKGLIIKNIDPATFKPIFAYYAKDAKHVYYEDKQIDGATPQNFKIINKGPYSTDGKDYFYYFTALHVSDYASFTLLDEEWAKDEFYYYIQHQSPQAHSNKYPLVDYKSFTPLMGGYAKDTFNVYYYGSRVDKADPGTFKTIAYGQGKDSSNLFYESCKIDDPKSYVYLNWGYSKDTISVYLKDHIDYTFEKIKNADPNSFVIFNHFWAKDKFHIYMNGEEVDFVDYDSFQYLIGRYVKDKTHVYYLDTVIVDIDNASAEATLSWDWIKDNKSYFFNGEKLKDIDYNTFQILKYGYAKDSAHVYFEHNLIDADVNSFTIDGTNGAYDKFGLYSQGKRFHTF